MAHEIGNLDKGMSKPAPWHLKETAGRWTVTGKTLTPEDAGLIGFERQDGDKSDIWNPILIPVYAAVGDGKVIAIPDSFHVARNDMPTDDARRFISCGRGVSGGYKLVTNRDIIDYANALGNFGAHVDSCGSVFNGQRVFFSMQLGTDADINGERAYNHLLLTTAHDGTACFEAILAPVLTVCNNTLQFNRRNAKTRVKIRHTLNVNDRMMEATEIIDAAAETFADSVTIMRNLATKKLSDAAARAFIEKHIGKGDGKRAENQRNVILDLYNGRQYGADLPSRKGTLFGVVNAISQYLETESTIRCHKDATGNVKPESEVRFDSIIFGSAAAKRDEVLTAAVAMLD